MPELLREVQDLLGLPWAPANFRAYARWPALAALLWSKVAPIARTELFLERALSLRDLAYREVASWYWRGSSMPGVDAEDRRRIRWELEALEYGNAQLLLIQSLIELALRDEVVGVLRDEPVVPRSQGHVFRVPELSFADSVRGVRVEGADERALAKWPEVYDTAMAQVRRWREEPVYFELCGALTREAHAHAMTLTPPMTLSISDLRSAVGEGEGNVEHAQRLIQQRSAALPSHIVNDAICLFALEGPMFAQPPREDVLQP